MEATYPSETELPTPSARHKRMKSNDTPYPQPNLTHRLVKIDSAPQITFTRL